MSCHDYEGLMSVLCTPLQVKCLRFFTKYGCFSKPLGLFPDPFYLNIQPDAVHSTFITRLHYLQCSSYL